MKPRKRCSTVLRVVVAKLLGVPRYVLDGIQLPPGLAWECLRVVVAGTRCGEWPKSSFSCQSGQDCRSGTVSVPADSLCFMQNIGCYTFSNVLPPKECVQPSSGRRRSPSAATSSASISSGHDRSAASAAASGMQPPVSLHRIDKHLEPFLAPSVTAAATFANGPVTSFVRPLSILARSRRRRRRAAPGSPSALTTGPPLCAAPRVLFQLACTQSGALLCVEEVERLTTAV